MRLREVFHKNLERFRLERRQQVSLNLYSRQWTQVVSFFWIRNAGYTARQLNHFLRSLFEFSALFFLTGSASSHVLVFGALAIDLISRSYLESITLRCRNAQMRGEWAFGKAERLVSVSFLTLLFALFYLFSAREVENSPMIVLLVFKGIEQFVSIFQFFKTFELQLSKRIYFPASVNFVITLSLGVFSFIYCFFEKHNLQLNLLFVGGLFTLAKIFEIGLSYYYYLKAQSHMLLSGSLGSEHAVLSKKSASGASFTSIFILLSKYCFLISAIIFAPSSKEAGMLAFAIGLEAFLGKFIERSFRSVYIDIVAAFQKSQLLHIERLLINSAKMCSFLLVGAFFVLVPVAIMNVSVWIILPWILVSLAGRAFFYFIYSIGIDEKKLFNVAIARYFAAGISAACFLFFPDYDYLVMAASFTLAEIVGLIDAIFFLKKFAFSDLLRLHIQKSSIQKLETRQYGVSTFFELKFIIQNYLRFTQSSSTDLIIILWNPIRNDSEMQKFLVQMRKGLRLHDLVIAENSQKIRLHLPAQEGKNLPVLKKKLLCHHPLLIKEILVENTKATPERVRSLKSDLELLQAKFRALIFDESLSDDCKFYVKDSSGIWRNEKKAAEKELQFSLVEVEETCRNSVYINQLRSKKIYRLKLSILPVVINGELIGCYVGSNLKSIFVSKVLSYRNQMSEVYHLEVLPQNVSVDIFYSYIPVLTSLLTRLQFFTEIKRGKSLDYSNALLYCEARDKTKLALFASRRMSEEEKEGVLIKMKPRRLLNENKVQKLKKIA